MNETLQRGIAALKAGNRLEAHKWLIAAVRETPNDLNGWLWLSGAVDSDSERLDCLRHVLDIDPNHPAAQRGMQQLLQKRAPSVSPIPDSAQAEAPAVDSAPVEQNTQVVEKETSIDKTEDVAPLSVAEADQKTQRAVLSISEVQPMADLPAAQNLVALESRAMPMEESEAKTALIFRARPSLVPAMVVFWGLVVGVLLMNQITQEAIELKLMITALTCGLLGLVMGYLFLHRLLTRYELSPLGLRVPMNGHRIRIAPEAIYDISTHQSAWQRILRIGNITIEANAGGVLRRIVLYDLPQFERHAQSIRDISSHLSIPSPKIG